MIQISLDYTSGIPVYVQIKEAIRRAVVSGAYPQGMQLPTVRQMAVTLKINANTVGRAYAELEREGVLASRQGRGTFVHLDNAFDTAKLAKLQQLMGKVIAEGRALGFSQQELVSIFDRVLKEYSANEEE